MGAKQVGSLAWPVARQRETGFEPHVAGRKDRPPTDSPSPAIAKSAHCREVRVFSGLSDAGTTGLWLVWKSREEKIQTLTEFIRLYK